MNLQVAGYADDTAIYLADSAMQTEAIEAVAAFSLNVDKSKAIRLGGEQVESTHNDSAAQNNVVEEVESTRYLWHIAGMGDTCSLAWKALVDTRVRLTLAEVKTNSVHQRAKLAAAVIIPKLLYKRLAIRRNTEESDSMYKEFRMECLILGSGKIANWMDKQSSSGVKTSYWRDRNAQLTNRADCYECYQGR
ncbi:LOW QUALITY PROTEIN: Reverse transcriptase precursor [Phytophthora megakarya]|uniref:Reverse transcriptase n=1 Tax=Phytophthora megakarya TaxID=4795 RepID=A0A225UKT7_9STRA|nr:LOW QUALITY PROTEIN: Reverse transcriptase precursor [Phytophthora megakarya]